MNRFNRWLDSLDSESRLSVFLALILLILAVPTFTALVLSYPDTSRLQLYGQIATAFAALVVGILAFYRTRYLRGR